LLIVALASMPLSALSSEVDLEGFDGSVAAAVAEWEAPGLAVAIVKDGAIVFEKGYGVTRLNKGTPVDQHTLFSIGSTTKAIAAAAIGILVDEGKLDWDDPVSEHLPQFKLSDPVVTERLRVRDLLTHNAGVPNTDLLWYEQANSLDEILYRMRYVELEAPMYSNFTYQNVMYAAAGKLTEVVSGKPWSEFVEQHIFKPIGMKRSVASLAGTRLRDNVASPHDYVDGKLIEIENASVDSVAAAGAIWSSVHDMSQWASFLMRGCKTTSGQALLSPETCNELFEPQTLVNREMYPAMRLYRHHWFTYALGWFQTDYQGRALDFHSGSIDGMVALIGLVRDEGLGVYILANRDHAEVRHAILLQALDLFSPEAGEAKRDWNRELKELFDGMDRESAESRAEEEQARTADSRQALLPSRYVGDYMDRLNGEVAVTVAGDQLRLRFGRRVCTLEPAGADRFSCPWDTRWRGETWVQFMLDSAGKVDRVEIYGLMFSRSD
jgi:CubicO group peptidase (beta-lactamase class C family)